jgi:hypothetical protein
LKIESERKSKPGPSQSSKGTLTFDSRLSTLDSFLDFFLDFFPAIRYKQTSVAWAVRPWPDTLATILTMLRPSKIARGWMLLPLLVVLSLAAISPAQDATAGAASPSGTAPIASQVMGPEPTPSFWTNRGRFTFGMQVGYSVEDAIPRDISHINLFMFQPAVGFIAWDSPGSRLPLSRFEVVQEGILGNAVHPGGRITGTTLLFRLDGKPHRGVVPFFDFGAGALNTTLDNRVPELTGHTQFMPQGGPGIQYFFNPQRAFVIQFRYMHMSNADLQLPNHGFNANMITLGFRWLRRPHPRGEALTPRSHSVFQFLFGK